MIELSNHGNKDSHLTKEKLWWLQNQMSAHYDVYSNQREHKCYMYREVIMFTSNNSFFLFFLLQVWDGCSPWHWSPVVNSTDLTWFGELWTRLFKVSAGSISIQVMRWEDCLQGSEKTVSELRPGKGSAEGSLENGGFHHSEMKKFGTTRADVKGETSPKTNIHSGWASRIPVLQGQSSLPPRVLGQRGQRGACT